MGGSQILGSPTGHSEEPGIYSVSDKELLKVLKQGTGMIKFYFYFYFFCTPILIVYYKSQS